MKDRLGIAGCGGWRWAVNGIFGNRLSGLEFRGLREDGRAAITRSKPVTDRGEHRSTMPAHRVPVPQSISSQRKPGSQPNQARNIGAIRRPLEPAYSSYGSPRPQGLMMFRLPIAILPVWHRLRWQHCSTRYVQNQRKIASQGVS